DTSAHGIVPPSLHDALPICSKAFITEVSQAQDGTLYPAVRDEDVLSGPIPLPPLPEQRRIVQKLDTLSARTATARAHLAAIEKRSEEHTSELQSRENLVCRL